MSISSDFDKKEILNFISELIDEKINALPAENAAIMSEESRKIKNSRSTGKLFAFFEDHGFHIISLTEKQNLPRDRVQLAAQLTKNRKTLSPFIQCLLHSNEETFLLEKDTQEYLTCLINICKLFANRQWIDFQYQKETKTIVFKRKPELKGDVKYFLSGIYGEFGTARIIEKVLQEFAVARNGFKYKIFHDIKLKRPGSPNQCDMQLDLVIQLPEGFCIFETKMGEVLAIDKWVDRTRLFASGKSHFITCGADNTLNHKIFRPFLLFNLDQLPEQMFALLNKDYPA